MSAAADLGHAVPARPPARLRVTMLGIRGFPDVQGGVENHAQNLSIRLVELGCDVEVLVRSAYVPGPGRRTWRNIKLVRLWSPRISGIEALIHSLLGVARAGWTRPDILHIHSIGPALFTPLARALGLRVVVTHHVLNYDNEKWGLFARGILRLGERAGMTFADGRIAVSNALARRIETAYGVPVAVIPNGIDGPQKVRSIATLQRYGLSPYRYALTVARIDAQKRQLDLIEAFSRARQTGWKLAIVGAADYSGEYAKAVVARVREQPEVVMLGHQSGAALAELYAHAGAFVLPSSHEGQPIAVLEAMSHGCPLVLSDIPAHRELAVSGTRFVGVGDLAGLAHCLSEIFECPPEPLDAAERDRLMQAHDWRQIAQRTVEVYLACLSGSSSIEGRHPVRA